MTSDGVVGAVGFVRALRGVGLDVPVGSATTYVEALAEVGVAEPAGVYWAGRATLVHRPEDVATYDAAFTAYYGQRAATVPLGMDRHIELALDAEESDGAADDDVERVLNDNVLAVRWSGVEVLREKDLAECSDDELAEAHRLMAQLRVAASQRRARRLRAAHRRAAGGAARLDLRGTVRQALRHGGEPIELARRKPRTKPRRLVLLVDVSGSMEPYARALVRFAHAAVAGRRAVDVFALGTRLTRLSRELATRDPDEALRAASAAVADWSGGTRLGAGMRAFNDEWGVRGMARGAVVVVLSDGWDRGDPTELAEQMARLARVAHKVVWVNPLKATPGYAPLAGGMAAALPYVDAFIEGHSVASLEHLAEVIGA